VAQEVRLIGSNKDVITGSDFDALSIEGKHTAVEKYQVFARVTPAQKYDIIKLLQEKYSVGFLGEGINDAPALKIANVGIVVEGAADAAREASDIVLLERSLKVILDGIEGGRSVFENTSKYITATMASNFGNFFAVAIIAPFITFLPMLPLQILLVNLLSDFPMILVATDNVEKDSLAVPKRYNLRNFAVSALSFGFISTVFDFILFSSFVRRGEPELQTYWFIESILSELLFLFSIRSLKPFYSARAPSKPLVFLTLFTIFLTIVIPFTNIGREVFGFIRPTANSFCDSFHLSSFK
jgi:Mg2+-importing ATPase